MFRTELTLAITIYLFFFLILLVNLGTWVLIGSLLCLLFHLKWCGGMRVVTLLAKDIDITSPLMPTSYLSNVSSHGVQLEPTHTLWSMVPCQDRHIFPVLDQYFSFYLSVKPFDEWLCSRLKTKNSFCSDDGFRCSRQAIMPSATFPNILNINNQETNCYVELILVFAQKMRLPIGCCPRQG